MNIRKQAGMTGLGWLTVLILIGFFVTIGLKIIPIQIDAYKVRTALERLNHVPNVTKMTNKEITDILYKQFSVDDVSVVTKKNITIKRQKGVLEVYIDYENRKPLIAPFDIVGVYKEEIKVIAH